MAQNKQSPAPRIAAFDADGTLWDCDVGEIFFKYQIENDLVPLPEGAFDHYLNLKKKNNDPREAFLWLAQISEGVELSVLQGWAKEAVNLSREFRVFDEQRRLMKLLQDHQFKIYVVTASVAWAVEAAVEKLGLLGIEVVGVRTEVVGGKITREPVWPVTFRQGKVEALLKQTGGIKPWLAAGNSSGDIELLSSAEEFALAVGATSAEDKLFESETQLQEIAKSKHSEERPRWRVHRF